jgi:hypothetical protein
MDPLQQLLLSLGQQRLQGQGVGGGIQPSQTLGQSLQPIQPQMLSQPMVPLPATGTGDTTTPVDEQGNPLRTYARGEPAFGNSRDAVTGGGYTPSGSNTPPADTGSSEAGGMGGGKAPFAGTGNKFLDALRGVQAPAPPKVQTVGTPNLPPLRPIDQGELVKLLASLGIGPQQAMSMKLGRG